MSTRRVGALLAFLLLIIPATSLVAQTRQEKAAGKLKVRNGTYEVKMLKTERLSSLFEGMLKPRDPNTVFFRIEIQTDDPCFDPEKNSSCFDAKMTSLERVARACGGIEIGNNTAVEADGGGRDGERLYCQYVIPKGATVSKLKLTGYPELEVNFK